MHLKDCTLGKLVVSKNDKRLGHIVGLCYSVSVENTGNMSPEEKIAYTIPLI